MVLDLMLPGMGGQEVLRQIRQRDPDQVVVVITAYSSIESAIEAMKNGAFHYIPKPFKNEEVLLTLKKGLDQRRLTIENRSLREQLKQRFGFDQILGKSQPMQQVFDLIRLAAPAKSNMMVLGESGTGKELVAKAIHHHSRRADGPFVTVNSGSMPADLLESSLFGHVKGSFTGAIANKKGLFELAHNGSIFFDEIGNIPLDTQAKLLRVIQEKEFMRLGGLETIKVDVRIIAATNADLESEVERGKFREDLYYRLNVITIALPPLRKRSEDVPLLTQHFLARYAAENDKPLVRIAPRAMELLMDYHWPGNVRELENVIERGVVLSSGDTLDVDLLPMSVRQPTSSPLPPASLPTNGHLAEGRGLGLRAPADHQGVAGERRGAEAGRRAVAGEADDAARDDEAAEHLDGDGGRRIGSPSSRICPPGCQTQPTLQFPSAPSCWPLGAGRRSFPSRA